MFTKDVYDYKFWAWATIESSCNIEFRFQYNLSSKSQVCHNMDIRAITMKTFANL